MRQSRQLLLELARSRKPLNEATLSRLTSIDRRTIRLYCEKFLASELVEWNYVTRKRHTEKMHRITDTGQSFALAIAIEDNQLPTALRRKLLSDIVHSMRELKTIRKIHALNRGFIRLLFARRHYDVLFVWNTHRARYLRNNPLPVFLELTWLSFFTDLTDPQLRQALATLEKFRDTLADETERLLFGILYDHFMPIPMRKIRRLTGAPDLEQVFKWHPELKEQLGRLHYMPNYDTIVGSVVGLEVPPELIHEKGPLQFSSKGRGHYVAEKATAEGIRMMNAPDSELIFRLHPELREEFQKLLHHDLGPNQNRPVTLKFDPRLLHENVPLKLLNKRGGIYSIEAGTLEGIQ